MPEVKAQLNYLRIAPRKMRLLADAIRGKELAQARTFLNFSIKKGALPLKKLLESCAANAKNNFNLEERNLVIREIKVDEGPKLKRWRARARGRAMPLQKKTSHITLVLEGESFQKKAAVEDLGEEAKKEVPSAARGEKKAAKAVKEKPKLKGERGIRKALAAGQVKKVFRRKAF